MVLSERRPAPLSFRPRRDEPPAPEQRLRAAVMATVVYADLFDFPLKRTEVHRDLIGVAAAPWRTLHAIDALVVEGRLVVDRSYLTLPSRVGLADVRRARQERAYRLWPDARRVGGVLSQLPFVRMVAVTGSLAAGNPAEHADLDYLLVTAPGRLWTVRALAVALVRLARRGGIPVCPNYLLSTEALPLRHRDVFTAHELLQAVPLAGHTVYHQLLGANPWVADWLPHRYAQAINGPIRASTVSPIQRLGESLLTRLPGDRLETWEFKRKQARLRPTVDSARFTPDVCEGHFGRSRQRTLHDFARHCETAGVAWPPIPYEGEGLGVSPRFTPSRWDCTPRQVP